MMSAVDVRFLASVSPIVRDTAAARRLFSAGLGLTFEGGEGNYVFTEHLGGVKHFGLWPLADAAQACFGTTVWPTEVPSPQASLEFEVDDVAAAAEELKRAGYHLLHDARTEPWGQVTARLITPDGLLIAVCYTPWLRRAAPSTEAFWQAVAAAEPVLASPRVRQRWDQPSALADMSVGDLTAHLVRAVTNILRYLSQPAPTGEPISAAAYYRAILDNPADLTTPQNRAVRDRARTDSAAGPTQVLQRWQEAIAEARRILAEAPADRLVAVINGLVLTLEQYLATRIVELLVHTDDLAVSIDIETPAPPAAAARLAERVLLDVARGEHGDTAVLRAMTRRERSSTEVLRVL